MEVNNRFLLALVITFLVFATINICGAQQSRALYFSHVIRALAHDSMQGRAPGTVYEMKSANFIINEINKIRQEHKSNGIAPHSELLSPQSQAFSFEYSDVGQNNLQKINGINVYCKYDNHADSTIVISAHYDHIGLGQSKSLSYHDKGQVHNGADDNASGVAMSLGLLKHMEQWQNEKYNYIFVFYSGHELGLHGSAAFEKMISAKEKNIELSINFDMVGRLDAKEKLLSIYGYENVKKSIQFFNQQFENVKLDITDHQKILETDGLHFFQKGISSISFTTGTHLDYHKTTDDERYINYDGMDVIFYILMDFLKSV